MIGLMPGLEFADSLLANHTSMEARIIIKLMLVGPLTSKQLETSLFGELKVSSHLVAMHISRIRSNKKSNFNIICKNKFYSLKDYSNG